MEAITLESPRCRLRRPAAADAESIAAAVCDARFPPNDSWRFVRNTKDAADRIRTQLELWEDGRALHFSVSLKASNEFVGQVALSREPEPDNWLLGYWIAPALWRCGLATEAAAAASGCAFTRLGAVTLWAGATPENVASLRVLEKLGFAFEAENPKGYRLAERWLTTREYVLQRAEWQARA